MQEWSVHVNIHYDGTRSEIEDATESYLDVLLEERQVIDPVTSANFHERSLSALFQIEAPNYVTAMQIATQLVPSSVQRAFSGGSKASVSGTGVALAPHHARMQGTELAHA